MFNQFRVLFVLTVSSTFLSFRRVFWEMLSTFLSFERFVVLAVSSTFLSFRRAVFVLKVALDFVVLAVSLTFLSF